MSNLKIIVTRRRPENVMQVKLEHLSNHELEYRQRGLLYNDQRPMSGSD